MRSSDRWPESVRVTSAAALAVVVAFSALAAANSPPPQGEGHRGQLLSPDGTEGALTALNSSLDVERDLLKSTQELYRQTIADREAAARRLANLLAELDALVSSGLPTMADAAATKDRDIADAEGRLRTAIQKGRELIGRIDEIQDRTSGLERKIAQLREGLPKGREMLSGGWRITYLPGSNHGIFLLRQNGTLVQGQYQLEGGWKGSLQGTFVDGKIYLQRIDSKLGRSSELEGYLAQDGSSIRGTWRNYNLTDGAVSSGSWVASRQED